MKLKILYVIIVLFVTAGCIVIPKTVPHSNNECILNTKSYTLDVKVIGNSRDIADQIIKEMSRVASSNCEKPECLIVLAPMLTISAGSLIISGSIAVIGNTIHWIEKEGACDDGVIKDTIAGLKSMVNDAGGFFIDTSDELIWWFQSKFELLT